MNKIYSFLDAYPAVLGILVLLWPLPLVVFVGAGWTYGIAFFWYIFLYLWYAKSSGGWSTVGIIVGLAVFYFIFIIIFG